MTLPWVLKYQPQSMKDFVAHKTQLLQMQQFITSFKQQKRKAMLLHGPTGVGKTVAVYALAQDNNCEVIEVNASDVRNKDAILSILGSATKQMSLFGNSKIVLVDEADGLSGVKDRGGTTAVEKVIAETRFPIFLTCQDAGSKKVKGLKKKSTAVTFEPVSYLHVTEILKQICTAEGVAFEETAIKTLARQVDGDVRAAINDLQTLAQLHEKITMQSLESLGYRNKEESIQDALIKIFKVKDPMVAKNALDNVHDDLGQVFLWVDENLPAEYVDPDAIVRAYNSLSRADVFKGRIRRWQYWRFLVYVYALMSAGVCVAKDERNKNPVVYKRSTRPLKIWMARQKYAKRKGIAEKIAAGTHTSSRYTMQHVLPYLKPMFQRKSPMAAAIAEEFELDPDEVAWLAK